jgi:hypothetical protein
MTIARALSSRLHAGASLEVLRAMVVMGCAAALALAGVSLRF